MDFMMARIVRLIIFSVGLIFLGAQLESKEYVKYVSDVTASFAREIEAEFNFYCCGDGGSMPNDVEEIDVSFITERKMTLEEAREVEVYMVTRFLELINAHEKLRPFLREYPFSPQRVSVSVSGRDHTDRHFSDGSVASVFLCKGNLCYYSCDPVSGHLKSLQKEPFVEAVKIVENSKDPKRGLLSHTSTPYESQLENFFDQYTKEMGKKHGLVCVRRGGKLANGIEEVGLKFNCSKKLPLERARVLEIEATERLVEMINANEAFRPYLKEYPFSVERTRMEIEFKNHQDDHYPNGNVAEVTHENGKLTYTTLELPPTPGEEPFNLKPLAQETYEEAKRAVVKPPLK